MATLPRVPGNILHERALVNHSRRFSGMTQARHLLPIVTLHILLQKQWQVLQEIIPAILYVFQFNFRNVALPIYADAVKDRAFYLRGGHIAFLPGGGVALIVIIFNGNAVHVFFVIRVHNSRHFVEAGVFLGEFLEYRGGEAVVL